MKIFHKIVSNDYLKIAISIGLCVLAIAIAVSIRFKSIPIFPDLNSNSEVSDLIDFPISNFNSHYIFVVDVSKSFIKVIPDEKTLFRCEEIISELERKFIINKGDYPTPKSSIDVTKLYIIETLLKLEKTSHYKNHFSIWTLGNGPRTIFPHSYKEINKENRNILVKHFIKDTFFTFPSQDDYWTDFTKLIEYLENDYKEHEQEPLNVSVISDFNYSIKNIENDLDFKKQEIIEEFQKLSTLHIKINRIELNNNNNNLKDGIYIGGRDYFEDIFGDKNTEHNILNLISLDKPFVSDFIYPHHNVFPPVVINTDKRKISTINLPKGDYRLNIPFNSTSNISSVKISILNSEKKEKQIVGKLRRNNDYLNFEIDEGDSIKLEFLGNIPEDIQQNIRLASITSGFVYSIPFEFRTQISPNIYLIIYCLLLAFLILVIVGLNQIRKDKKQQPSKEQDSW